MSKQDAFLDIASLDLFIRAKDICFHIIRHHLHHTHLIINTNPRRINRLRTILRHCNPLRHMPDYPHPRHNIVITRLRLPTPSARRCSNIIIMPKRTSNNSTSNIIINSTNISSISMGNTEVSST